MELFCIYKVYLEKVLMRKYLKWLQKRDRYFWIIAFLTLVGAILRFWNLENSQQFLGDQGRDALVVAKIFREHDPVFTGPVTSIGNMYLGPAYYYFMMPFLWLTYPSPMGPVVAVVLLGIITIPVLFKVGSELLDKRSALIASFFYTFAPSVITYTRFSWNPNPAPLVSLFLIWGIYRAFRKSAWYWILVFAMMSLLLQLHYVALLMGGVIAVFWLLALFNIFKKTTSDKKAKKSKKEFFLSSLLSGGILLASIVPLILFDWKHQWINLNALKNIFVKEEAFEVAGGSRLESLRNLVLAFLDRLDLSLSEVWFGEPVKNNWFLIIALILLTYLATYFYKQKKEQKLGFAIILVTLLISVVGLAFYQHSIYVHYLTFLFPVSFLLLGATFHRLLSLNPLIASGVIVIFSQYFGLSALKNINYSNAGTPISKIKQTAEVIVGELQENEPYSIALLSGTKDILGQNYLYFLYTLNKPPVPEYQRGSSQALFIIDEEHKEDEVLKVLAYEITLFKDWRVEKVVEIPAGPTITVARKADGVE